MNALPSAQEVLDNLAIDTDNAVSAIHARVAQYNKARDSLDASLEAIATVANITEECEQGQGKSFVAGYKELLALRRRVDDNQRALQDMSEEMKRAGRDRVKWETPVMRARKRHAMEANNDVEKQNKRELEKLLDALWKVHHPDSVRPKNDAGDDDDDDDDLEMVGEKQSYKCMITGELIHDLLEAPCSHYFSREGIESLLGRSPSVKCPMPSCNRTVTKAELRPNKPLERRLWRAAEHDAQAGEEDAIDFTQG